MDSVHILDTFLSKVWQIKQNFVSVMIVDVAAGGKKKKKEKKKKKFFFAYNFLLFKI